MVFSCKTDVFFACYILTEHSIIWSTHYTSKNTSPSNILINAMKKVYPKIVVCNPAWMICTFSRNHLKAFSVKKRNKKSCIQTLQPWNRYIRWQLIQVSPHRARIFFWVAFRRKIKSNLLFSLFLNFFLITQTVYTECAIFIATSFLLNTWLTNCVVAKKNYLVFQSTTIQREVMKFISIPSSQLRNATSDLFWEAA